MIAIQNKNGISALKKRGFAGKGFWEILPLGLGSTLSLLTLAVTGTHLNARKLQEMAAWTDLDQMPVETDCP